MPIHEQRFQLSIDFAGLTPAALARAFECVAPGWQSEGAAAARRATLVTPVLGFADLETVRQALRAARRAGALFDEACSIQLRIDAARVDDRVMRTLQSLLAKQAELLARVLGRSIAQLGFERIKGAPPFAKGAIVVSLRPTPHAGESLAAIVLALAIVERALTARAASSTTRPFFETSARYDFRCFLLRLSLVGEDFREVREQLLKRLPGSAAWKHGRPQRAA